MPDDGNQDVPFLPGRVIAGHPIIGKALSRDLLANEMLHLCNIKISLHEKPRFTGFLLDVAILRIPSE